MKTKLILICFISFLFSFLIYYFFKNDKLYILSLGDDLSLGTTPFHTFEDSYDDFFKEYLNGKNELDYYNNFFINKGETYKSINYKFDEDYSVNVKNQNISLRKSIADADIIIIALSNDQNFEKCKLSKNRYIEYFKNNIKEIKKFYNKIKIITNAKIIILGNYCYDFSREINNEILYIIKELPNDINFINLYESIHNNNINIPNKKILYPSLEGYYYIFENIVNIYNNLDI